MPAITNNIGSSTNAAGIRPVTAAPATLPVPSKDTPATPAQHATPVLAAGANSYEIGLGHEFTSADAFAAFIDGKNFIRTGATATVKQFDNQTLSRGFSITSDPAHGLVWGPAPGQAFHQRATPNSPIYAPAAGVKLTITSRANIGGQVVFQDLWLATAVSDIYGAIGFAGGGAMPGFQRCYGEITSLSGPLAAPQYGMINESSIWVRSAGTGPVIGGFAPDSNGCTYLAKGTATSGGYQCGYQGGQIIQNNIAVNCGPKPFSTANANASYTNNFANSGDTSNTLMMSGLTVDTVHPLVRDVRSDLRPAPGGIAYGKGNSHIASLNDAYGNNRGLRPDAGALQDVPAMALPVLACTAQTLQGQAISYFGTYSNAPVSGTLSVPAEGVPAGAVQQGPLPVTLTPTGRGHGTWAIAFKGLPPGNYGMPVIAATNAGGNQAGSGGAPFSIIGIIGNPEAPQNPASATAATRTIVIPVAAFHGTAPPNEADLTCAVFSQTTPDSYGRPIAQGGAALVDEHIVFTFSSILPVGTVVGFAINTGDRTTAGRPQVQGFSAPVVLT